MQINELKLKSNQIRIDIVKTLFKAQSGHLGGALGLSDIFTVLYFEILKHNPKKPNWNERDFLILSNGHVNPVLYVTLAHCGYFPINELKTLRNINSRLQGHPHNNSLPGIENSSGPLGQGISQAVGLASSLLRDGKDNNVFCICGDGELEEGQCWEAFMFASKEKLDNFILIVDRNNLQIDGNTEEVSKLEPLHKKFSSFGFLVIEFDGNNIAQIIHALKESIVNKGKPIALIAKTIMGKGVSFAENNHLWHGKFPNKEEFEIAISELKKERKELEMN